MQKHTTNKRDMNNDQDKDTKFLISIASKIAIFMNQMTSFCLKTQEQIKNSKQIGKNQHEQQSQDQSISVSQKQDHKKKNQQNNRQKRSSKKLLKKKYGGVRTRLPQNVLLLRPKAPTSSFLVYYHANKEELAKKFGKNNVTQLTRYASTQWRILTQAQRDKYVKISQQSKDRYQKQMEIFKSTYANQIQSALKQRKMQYKKNSQDKKRAQDKKVNDSQEGSSDSSSDSQSS